ncbi:hypothetical protein RSAG8_12795, partial [Rhizoctonia solani AG-8 WAC10335]
MIAFGLMGYSRPQSVLTTAVEPSEDVDSVSNADIRITSGSTIPSAGPSFLICPIYGLGCFLYAAFRRRVEPVDTSVWESQCTLLLPHSIVTLVIQKRLPWHGLFGCRCNIVGACYASISEKGPVSPSANKHRSNVSITTSTRIEPPLESSHTNSLSYDLL